jgi:hypothetical protein
VPEYRIKLSPYSGRISIVIGRIYQRTRLYSHIASDSGILTRFFAGSRTFAQFITDKIVVTKLYLIYCSGMTTFALVNHEIQHSLF